MLGRGGTDSPRQQGAAQRMPSGSAPHFIMGQDYLWIGEEYNVGDLNYPNPGDLHRDKLNRALIMDGYLLLCSTSIYCIEDQHFAPCCPRGSLVP